MGMTASESQNTIELRTCKFPDRNPQILLPQTHAINQTDQAHADGSSQQCQRARDLPRSFHSSRTSRTRSNRSSRNGIFQKMHQRLQTLLPTAVRSGGRRGPAREELQISHQISLRRNARTIEKLSE